MGPIRFANLFGILTSPGAVRRTSTRVPSDTYNSYLVLLLVCISMIIQYITILRNGNIIANSAIRRWANGIRAREYLRVSLLLSTNVLNERLITYFLADVLIERKLFLIFARSTLYYKALYTIELAKLFT